MATGHVIGSIASAILWDISVDDMFKSSIAMLWIPSCFVCLTTVLYFVLCDLYRKDSVDTGVLLHKEVVTRTKVGESEPTDLSFQVTVNVGGSVVLFTVDEQMFKQLNVGDTVSTCTLRKGGRFTDA